MALSDDKWPKWAQAILDALAETPLETMAWGASEVTKTAFEQLKWASPRFAEAVEVAKAKGARAMLMKARSRGDHRTVEWVLDRTGFEEFVHPDKREEARRDISEYERIIQELTAIAYNFGGEAALQAIRETTGEGRARHLTDGEPNPVGRAEL